MVSELKVIHVLSSWSQSCLLLPLSYPPRGGATTLLKLWSRMVFGLIRELSSNIMVTMSPNLSFGDSRPGTDIIINLFIAMVWWYFYFYQSTMVGLLRWTNSVFLGQEFGLEWWNVLNYQWGFFRNKLEIFGYRVIPNNISDKNSLHFFLILYYEWISSIITNNILNINLIQVFYP
jgi:hypothetical protein